MNRRQVKKERLLLKSLLPVTCYLLPITLAFLLLGMLPLGKSLLAEDETIKIGVLGPLSGHASAYGISQKQGVELAVEEINSSGLLRGKKIELVIHDDEANMKKAGPLAAKMAFEDGIVALIGNINSDCTHVSQMVTVKAHIPQLTTTSTDPTITEAGNPWMFRCLADDVLQSRALSDYIFDELKLQRVALLQHNNRYGKMGGRELVKSAKRHGKEVVAQELFDSGQSDFEPLLKRVKEAGAEAVVIWGLYRESALIVKQARERGYEMPFFGSDGLASPMFIEIAGDASEGVILTYPFDSTRNDPLTQRFRENYRRRFGQEPDSFAAHSYDAMFILKEAIVRGGSEPNRLRDELAKTRGFHGVTGVISFDDKGNDARKVMLARVKGGQFVPLKKDDSSWATQ